MESFKKNKQINKLLYDGEETGYYNFIVDHIDNDNSIQLIYLELFFVV